MQRVRQFASAAIASIIFALILGVVIWLFHDAAPDLTLISACKPVIPTASKRSTSPSTSSPSPA